MKPRNITFRIIQLVQKLNKTSIKYFMKSKNKMGYFKFFIYFKTKISITILQVFNITYVFVINSSNLFIGDHWF